MYIMFCVIYAKFSIKIFIKMVDGSWEISVYINGKYLSNSLV